MNGKERFIRHMAATELGKRPIDVTDAQHKAAKTLFLAMAYNAIPEVVAKLKNELRHS